MKNHLRLKKKSQVGVTLKRALCKLSDQWARLGMCATPKVGP